MAEIALLLRPRMKKKNTAAAHRRPSPCAVENNLIPGPRSKTNKNRHFTIY
jgi:hypothetical protein